MAVCNFHVPNSSASPQTGSKFHFRCTLQEEQITSTVLNENKETGLYRGADKSLARPGRKQTTVTEDFDVHISYLLSQVEEY